MGGLLKKVEEWVNYLRKFIQKFSKEEIGHKGLDGRKRLLDIEYLEKRDWQLWLLAIFIILVLTLFIVINYFHELSGFPRQFLKDLTFLNIYITGSAVLILTFCIYILRKNGEIRRLRREIFGQRIRMQDMVGSLEEVGAIFQISSLIGAHKDLDKILEVVARESLQCLRADRSAVFLLDGKSGILKTQFAYAPDRQNEQVSLFEEREVVRKTVRQRRSLLLREPKDFSDFFKYEQREHKVTSLMSIPLFSQHKAIGALSLVLINGDRPFDDKDMQSLSIFGNQASIAIENAYLLEELRKGVSFRKSYERYLDDILNQLQNLSEEERRRIEEHIGRLLPGQTPEEKQLAEEPVKEKGTEVEEDIQWAAELAAFRGQDERAEEMIRVEFADSSLGFADDLTTAGVFIRTPNPMELGEQVLLKLHILDGAEPLEVACKVIWTNKYGKESQYLRRGMGVKFLNLEPEVQKRIEEYVQSQKKKEVYAREEKSSVEVEGSKKKVKGFS